jgi:GWxTD domain-containing protein
MLRVVRTLSVSIFSIAFAIFPALAQQAQDPATPPISTKKPDKEAKRRMKKTLKELDSAYRQWLTEDVTYIISPDERNAFLQLDTNEEREQFIEQFWLRRSNNPDLPDNDFKEEHYRRIAYANEHYASGIPGWRTDRGRMYIMWGPADEVESHPTGGTYDRPMAEGGGSTSTYPWETWRWRYLEGIGENVILEFVDPSGSGEYHMTMDPSEKDALLHVPGAGLSLLESMGMASKTDRFTRTDGTNLPTALGGTPASMDEFTRLELYSKVNKPPEVKFKDLEAVVTSRIVRDQVHFNWRADYMKVTNDTVLVQGRNSLRDDQYFWACELVDRPRGANIRRLRQPRFPGFSLSAIVEAPIDLSEGCAPSSGPVPAGSGDQGCPERKCRRREHPPAGAALRR